MILLVAGQRLYPDTEVRAGDYVLRLQGDGNLVLYWRGIPVWSSGTHGRPPLHAELQADGQLVIYFADGSTPWGNGSFGSDAVLRVANGALEVAARTTVWRQAFTLPDLPPPPTGPVRQIVGHVRTIGKSFGDDTGPRLVHGCTDFGGVRKYHNDRDAYLRTLDVVARYQQFIRAAWRLNGEPWVLNDTTVDPIRHGWYDEAMRGFLSACHERGIRVNLTCADMFNWAPGQAEESIARVAQIAASVSPEVVWLHEWNEARGTVPAGEGSVDWLRDLTNIWIRHYPGSLRGLSDPGSQDKAGMQQLSPNPANVALIHDVRWTNPDAIRRTFNTAYENYPGKPVVQGEPTGPNGSPPHSPLTRRVYQPTEDPDELFAVYTMHVLSGQASTYFNDPAIISPEPLDSTWGFKELPTLWRQMEIPENIGQGELLHGGRPNAMLRVVGSHAHRADGCTIGPYNLGCISGGTNWRVRSGRDGVASGWRASGKVWERRVSQGEVLEEPGPKPTVVRIVS